MFKGRTILLNELNSARNWIKNLERKIDVLEETMSQDKKEDVETIEKWISAYEQMQNVVIDIKNEYNSLCNLAEVVLKKSEILNEKLKKIEKLHEDCSIEDGCALCLKLKIRKIINDEHENLFKGDCGKKS